jgi:hypothetical protein
MFTGGQITWRPAMVAPRGRRATCGQRRSLVTGNLDIRDQYKINDIHDQLQSIHE